MKPKNRANPIHPNKHDDDSETFLNAMLAANGCKTMSLKKAIRRIDEIANAIYEAEAARIGKSHVRQILNKEAARDFAALQQARTLFATVEQIFSGKLLSNPASGSANQLLN